MKKLLLASTALVLSAGMASAQGVTLSGDGRMGLERIASGDIVFTSRARVTFTLSGETDMGLAFGGSFRADNAPAASRGQAGFVFVSGDFGRLRMGDVDGAALQAVGDLHMTSLTGIGDLNEMTYLQRSTDDLSSVANGLVISTLQANFANLPRAVYDYSIDGFSVFLSIDNPAVNRTAAGVRESSLQSVAVGAQYTFEGFTGGIGYEDVRVRAHAAAPAPLTPNTTQTAKHVIASAAYEFEGFEIKGIAGRVSGDLGRLLRNTTGVNRSQYGVSVQGKFDEVTVSAFAKRGFATTDYGIGASYDLGGGAAIAGGISRRGANNTIDPAVLPGGATRIPQETRADLGVTFSF